MIKGPMNTINQLLNELIECAKPLGLNSRDITNAQEYLDHREYGLCFDTLITQLHEFDIEINEEYYTMINKAAEVMHLPLEDYSFMRKLIRNKIR